MGYLVVGLVLAAPNSSRCRMEWSSGEVGTRGTWATLRAYEARATRSSNSLRLGSINPSLLPMISSEVRT